MLKIDLSPQYLGDYESRLEGHRWHIVRLSDGARFVHTCPKRGYVTRDWGYQVGAESWIRVLREHDAAGSTSKGGAWIPARQAGAEGVPTMQSEPEPDDDFDGLSDEPGGEEGRDRESFGIFSPAAGTLAA